MIYHKRTEHFDEKPFSCDECGAKFAANSSLKNHMRLHTGEKPYCCKHCNMNFSVAAALAYHTKKKHSEGNPEQHIAPWWSAAGTVTSSAPCFHADRRKLFKFNTNLSRISSFKDKKKLWKLEQGLRCCLSLERASATQCWFLCPGNYQVILEDVFFSFLLI